MKVIEVKDGQTVGEALAEAGAPDAVIGLVSAIMGEDAPLCDCPPGVCLEDSAVFNGPTSDLFDEEEDEDDLDIHFEPDFVLSDEPEMSNADKVEAVAQLGRIIEGLTLLVEDHAALVKKLVA
jgi:hypothetical protein